MHYVDVDALNRFDITVYQCNRRTDGQTGTTHNMTTEYAALVPNAPCSNKECVFEALGADVLMLID